MTTTHIHAPVRTLSQRTETSSGRWLSLNPRNRPLEPLIKTKADYDVAIYLLDNEEFYADYGFFHQKEAEIGVDGIVSGSSGIGPPYEETIRFLRFRDLLPTWFNAQLRDPHEFEKLVRACER